MADKLKRLDNRGRELKEGETQRADGRYMYSKMINGVRKTVYSWKLLPSDKIPQGRKNELSLREKAKKLEKELEEVSILTNTTITLQNCYDEYINNKKNRGRGIAQSSKLSYNAIWKKIPTSLKNKKLKDIKDTDILKLYKTLKSDDVGYGSIILTHKLLSAIFNRAVNKGLIYRNPARGVIAEIEGKQKKVESLSVEQQEGFLDYLEKNNPNLYRQVYFLILTGLRISEFAGLTWSNINFKENYIMIDHQLQYIKKEDTGKCGFIISPTKTRENRVIPLVGDIVKILQDMKQFRGIGNVIYLNRPLNKIDIKDTSQFVFLTSHNKLISDNGFNKALAVAVKHYNNTDISEDMKIDYLAAHRFRHTASTRYSEASVTTEEVGVLLGHRNKATTLDYITFGKTRLTTTLKDVLEK